MTNFRVIEFDSTVHAIFIPSEFTSEENIVFFTKDKEEFQLGGMKRLAGSRVAKHRHRLQNRNLIHTSEFLYIKSGLCEVSIFGENKKKPREATLIERITCKSGDMILLFRGIHSIDFLEDTYLFEVKQGPYIQENDKELI